MAKHRCAPARRPGRMAALALTAGIGVTALTGTSFLASPAQAAAQDIVTVDPATRQADAQLILDEINRYRQSLGVKPVRYSATLSQVVQTESDRQVAEERFSHSTNFLTDARTGPWTSANEVIALEYHRDVRALVRWWQSSAAHDLAIKDPRHEVIGIGLTYADGDLERTGQPWQVLSTVNLYGYEGGGAPSDASTRVGGAPAYSYQASSPVAPAGFGVAGAIGAKYFALGGAAVLGQPVTAERAGLRSGGVYQEFSLNGRKSTMYWSPATGAHWLENTTTIGQRFVAAGREHGYGYPITEERRLPEGSSYQVYSRDGVVTKMLWTRAHGAHAVLETGAIGRAWKAAGHEHGYGYPVTDEIRSGATVHQRFSHGYQVNWSSLTGQVWVTGW
ncbi:MAG: CAP domain-containing protein [Actinomycetota bacterium]